MQKNENFWPNIPTRKHAVLLWALIALILTAALSFFSLGCKAPPAQVERSLFDIETNLVARIVFHTNLVPSYQTNFVTVWRTNVVPSGDVLVVPVTNTVVETQLQSVVTAVSNFVPEVSWKPNTNAAAIQRTAGNVAGLFGPLGELVAFLFGTAFTGYAYLRSTRATRTSAALAQVIETGRALLQQTPQGRQLDNEWKAWMIQHQAEQGVINDVITILRNSLDSGYAKRAADDLLRLMAERHNATSNNP